MTFIRQKRIKKATYAYLVENVWTKKGSRQKIVGYLGRIAELEPVKEESFLTFLKKDIKQHIAEISFEEIVKDLVIFELEKHGFKREGNKMILGNITVDTNNYKTYKTRKQGGKGDIVLKTNEGFICKDSLHNLLKYKPFKEDEREDAIELARLLVEAGLKVEKEAFIEIFAKLVKN